MYMDDCKYYNKWHTKLSLLLQELMVVSLAPVVRILFIMHPSAAWRRIGPRGITDFFKACIYVPDVFIRLIKFSSQSSCPIMSAPGHNSESTINSDERLVPTMTTELQRKLLCSSILAAVHLRSLCAAATSKREAR